MIQITYKNRKLDVEPLTKDKRVCKYTTKTGSSQYYIQCNVTGSYDFRHQQAMDSLLKKYKTFEEVGMPLISN